MAKDNQILVRVNDPTNESVEEFAEDRDLNKAEAVRKIVESRLKGEGYLQRHYDNDVEPIPDGGQIMEKLDGIEKEVSESSSSVSELKKEAEEENLAVAESPFNDTDPFLVLTFALTVIIALGVFNVI
jgi:heme oxygenase